MLSKGQLAQAGALNLKAMTQLLSSQGLLSGRRQKWAVWQPVTTAAHGYEGHFCKGRCSVIGEKAFFY